MNDEGMAKKMRSKNFCLFFSSLTKMRSKSFFSSVFWLCGVDKGWECFEKNFCFLGGLAPLVGDALMETDRPRFIILVCDNIKASFSNVQMCPTLSSLQKFSTFSVEQKIFCSPYFLPHNNSFLFYFSIFNIK